MAFLLPPLFTLTHQKGCIPFKTNAHPSRRHHHHNHHHCRQYASPQMILDNEQFTNPRIILELYTIFGYRLAKQVINRLKTVTSQINSVRNEFNDILLSIIRKDHEDNKNGIYINNKKREKPWVIGQEYGEFIAIRRGSGRGVRLFFRQVDYFDSHNNNNNNDNYADGKIWESYHDDTKNMNGDVLLLHGMFGNVFCWRKVESQLSNLFKGNVISFDWPPFGLTEVGRSVNQDELYGNQDGYLSLLNELARLKRLKNVVIVAHSLSAYMGLRSAGARWVKGVVLVAPVVCLADGGWVRKVAGKFLDIPGVATKVVRDRVRRIAGDEWEKRILRKSDDVGNDGDNGVDAEMLKEMRKGYMRPLLIEGWEERLVEWMKRWQGWDLIQEMRTLKDNGESFQVPVLILAGDADSSIPLEQLKELCEEIPNAELRVLTDCGHIPHEEKPVQLVDAIKEWSLRNFEYPAQTKTITIR